VTTIEPARSVDASGHISASIVRPPIPSTKLGA
jgi:hypothetical protein